MALPLHPIRLLVVTLSALTLLSACEDPRITPETFPREYALALCSRAGRCGGLAPYLVARCEALSAERIQPEDVTRAVAAGRISYDEEAARRCIDGIESTRCLAEDIDDVVQASCNAALEGTVQTGGECSFLFECAAGLCGGSAGATCPATCPEVLGEGASCSRFFGPECDVRAGLRCSGGACVRPAGQDGSCVDNLGCGSGFICVEEKCVPLHQQGDGCSADSSCAEGLFCEDGICAARKREGARCSSAPNEVDAALRGAQCQDGLVCKGAGLDMEGNPVSGTCARLSVEGGTCLVDPPDAQVFLSGCQAGLICVNGACALPPSSGTCANSTCRSDQAYCSSDNVCVALLPNGADCRIPPECASRTCVDNKCVPERTYCHE